MITSIYVLMIAVFSSIAFLAIGTLKKDATIIFFSGFLFIVSGLNLVIIDFWLGACFIFFAIYLIFRTGIEMIKG